MTTERTCLNCKYLHRPKCPHRDNESIRKANHEMPLRYLGDDDFKQLEKLCTECPKFDPGE